MEILKSDKFTPVDSLVASLDSFRVFFLRVFLKARLLRHPYSLTHYRLALGMVFSTIFYLPIAFMKPELLLSFGPLIFGYPHLVASYRFTTSLKKFHLFIFMTFVAIILHVSKVGFAHFDQLPFGVWQIVVATMTLIFSMLISKSLSLKKITIAFLVCVAIVRLAWLEPVMYVGGALIAHNWVAFIYWILASKQQARRVTAIFSTVLFLIIHLFVLNGQFDFMIPMNDGAIHFAGASQVTGWYLASWTTDPLVWYRFLVLYSFGLSIHYFVWLRAIPESINKFEHPNCFRLSFKNLQKDLGTRTLLVTVLLILVGTVTWLLSFPLGSSIYFEIAILHGSLELIFLVPKIIKRFEKLSP